MAIEKWDNIMLSMEWDDTSAEILGDWGILGIFWRFLGDPSAGCKDLEVLNLGKLDESFIRNQDSQSDCHFHHSSPKNIGRFRG